MLEKFAQEAWNDSSRLEIFSDEVEKGSSKWLENTFQIYWDFFPNPMRNVELLLHNIRIFPKVA